MSPAVSGRVPSPLLYFERNFFTKLPESLPKHIKNEIQRLGELFTIDTAKLKHIAEHFVIQLNKGLQVEGATLRSYVTWVMDVATGDETGVFLALDLGGTNLRVCEIHLTDKTSEFDIIQSKYRIPPELKSGTAEQLWDYVADCLMQFVETHHGDTSKLSQLPLGLTFSYPAQQNHIDEGILMCWTKGYDITGVEGHNVVPQLNAALTKRGVPIKVLALLNDTVGTLVASSYVNERIRIACIFGTGCNAAYMERCGSIPKIAHLNLPPDMPMAINIEWGAFDNEGVILPRTPYDVIIDAESPRPGEQAFEKMISGLYLGEQFRLIMVELHEKEGVQIFKGQNISALRTPYTLDTSFLSDIEEDKSEGFTLTRELYLSRFDLRCTPDELVLIRHAAELIGTRSARLSACGVAGVAKKINCESCHVGADGSVYHKYPYFKARGALALREIFDWPEKQSPNEEDPIEIVTAEDGSGVGAALVAALTQKRVRAGNLAGVLYPSNFL